MKLIIGFLTYNNLTVKYLPYFLRSLKEQTFNDFQVMALDNSKDKDNENSKYIKKNYPKIEIKWAGKNLGFAKANNIIIKKAIERRAEYILLLNPDTILETNAIEKLVGAMEIDKELGSVSPKILKWDFSENKKTNIIDTCGIFLKPGLKFIDLGESLVDQGQFNNTEILGPSGAAAMYRVTALEKIKQAGEYFDELMFMYKEDCDLAYRLRLAGWKAKCIGEAIIYHDRTVSGAGHRGIKIAMNRLTKSKQSKKWSFLNQHIIYLKYWHKQSFINKFNIFMQILKIFLFVILFEQYLIKEYWNLYKINDKIKKGTE